MTMWFDVGELTKSRRKAHRRPWAALLLGASLIAGCASSDAPPADEPEEETPDYVEHFPGESLAVTSPPRGTFIGLEAGNILTVEGIGADADLTVNGQPVAPDDSGAFSTQVELVPGLNLVTVADGEGSIDTPVIWGNFAPTDQPVPGALSVRVNKRGFINDDPNVVSITRVAQATLDDVDLLAALQGQTLTGSIPGGSWSLKVWGTDYSGTGVAITPRFGGAGFAASVYDVQVHGTLTIDLLFSKTDEVTISADAVDVGGAINASLQGTSLAGSASQVQAELYGFQYDSGNAGLPCCVDGILTNYLRPKVQAAIQDKVREIMATDITFALEQFAMPEAIDLSAIGLPASLGIGTYLDGASFDQHGVTLSAAAHFAAPLQPGMIGETAPGWIAVGQGAGAVALDPSFGISVSLDALNQALHAAWAQDGLKRTFEGLPMVDVVLVEPRLPPMVLPNPDGSLSARAGEVVLHATVGGTPIQAAINVIGDVAVQLDPVTQQLTLVPGPTPHVSVTWLMSEGLQDGLRDLVKNTILDMVPELLAPISLPVPTLPLGAITPSLGGMVGVLGPNTTLGVEPVLGRVQLLGDLAMVPAAP